MPGTITIKGGINSVIQNDTNDNLIVTTNDASKQIYFQGTSSADAPMVIDENGKTIFQDTGSGQAVSLAVSQTSFGGYQLSFTSGSTELNAIKLIQDTSGSGAGQKRALISLSGSSTTNVGVNYDTPYVDRLGRGYGEMFVSTGAGGLSVFHFGVNPYSHSFFIGNHLTYLGAYETATFEVQDDSYGNWSNPNIIHRLPTQMTQITASGDISSSGTITMLSASIGGGMFTSASLAAGGSSDDLSWNDGTATRVSGSHISSASFGHGHFDRLGVNSKNPGYTLQVAGDMGIANYIYHNGDEDTHILMETDMINLVAGGKSIIKGDEDEGWIRINNTNANLDFQVNADDGEIVLHSDAGTNRVGINTTAPSKALTVTGEISSSGNITTQGILSATRKSFVINHQQLENHTLVHGSLEGPEFGVYIRGKVENDNKIALPDYWEWLVDEDSISVHITPIGYHILPLYFKEIKDNYVYVNKKTNFYYYICAERKDIEKLKIIEKK